MKSALKLAVVGAGVMGRNHLRAAQAADIPIAAVIDTDRASAEAAAETYGCAVGETLDGFDAAIIAVPTAAHAPTALPLLNAGIHCLVEKPFAGSEAECQALMDAAAVRQCVLQVGHIERFNPAITALLNHVPDLASVRSLTARRMGPASARVTDISVVLDLMVHDLDIVLALKPQPVTGVQASGTRDHAEATLTFADGATAHLTASRTWPERVRDLVVDAGKTYAVNYIAKTLQIDGDAPQAFTGDALGAQLASFLECIRDHGTPRVTGATALHVMKTAWRIEQALGLEL